MGADFKTQSLPVTFGNSFLFDEYCSPYLEVKFSFSHLFLSLPPLECLVHHLGLALGGRPAASFAKRLMLPVSNDTLLRVVRRRARCQPSR